MSDGTLTNGIGSTLKTLERLSKRADLLPREHKIPFQEGIREFSATLEKVQAAAGDLDRLTRLSSFPELNPEPVMEIDASGRMCYINPAAERFLSGLPEAGFGHPWLRGLDQAGDEAGKSGRVPTVRELNIGDRWFEQLVVPVQEGRRLRIYGRDITERKKAEEALRTSEERFKFIATSTPDHLLVQDADLRYTMVVNPQLHLTEKDMLGRTDFDILSREDAEALTKIKKRVLKTGNPEYQSIPVTSRSGETNYFAGTYVPKRDAEGRIDGILGFFRNVTEQKRADRELQRLNRTLTAFSKSSQALSRIPEESEYLNEVCRIIVEDCGHAMVWIGYAENDEGKTVKPAAWAGFEAGYLDTLRVTWADSPRGRGPTGTAIRTGQPVVCRDMRTDPEFELWREEALKRGYASSIALPLKDKDKAMGAIMIYSREPDPFTRDELDLLTELADNLARGITAIRLRAAHAVAEQALRESEERYRSLFSGMTEGFALHEIICDEKGEPVDYRFLDINPAFERLTGLKRKDVVGRLMSEVLPGDEPGWVKAYGGVALTGTPAHFENYSPGLKRHYEVYSYRPAPGQFAVLFMDVTKRRQIEEELQSSRVELETRVRERTAELRRQAELLDLANDAIIVRTLDGDVRFWNKGAEGMYGWTRDEALGRNKTELLRPQTSVPLEYINAEIQSSGRWEGEITHLGKNAQPILVFSRQVMRTQEAGRPPEILEINQDVTERRQAEERLRQWQKIEALGTLAGGIAHDFNNILVPIMVNTELAMMDVPEADPLGRHLQIILEATNRGRDLVKQIIAFSRQREEKREIVDVVAVVREALRLLKSSIPTSVEIRERFSVESSLARADATQIHQVLVNLCSNAAAAMRGGGRMDVSLDEVEIRRGAPSLPAKIGPGRYLKLTVADTGHGMSRDVLGKIFDPFFTTKKPGEGAGLGLAVAHGIVRSHGGAITVTSEVGKGSSFEVLLPRLEGEHAAGPAEAGALPTGKERILFVDDEDLVLHSIQPALERLGYRVTGRTSAADALALFREKPDAFDLVLTDQTMPGITGEKLAREILTVRPGIPIILSTGFSEVVQETDVRALGIREFILKPFSVSEIAEKIRKALAKG